MNLSIAQEFIRFRDIFFEELARQKELNFTLREQIKFLLQEVKNLRLSHPFQLSTASRHVPDRAFSETASRVDARTLVLS